ncbi:hypothetical protein BDQ17DRAFT_1332222 [Cyathus striatus]|nr:hypothetical protein BDQ17DRAFT_1332222 [Cyathus striatus]
MEYPEKCGGRHGEWVQASYRVPSPWARRSRARLAYVDDHDTYADGGLVVGEDEESSPVRDKHVVERVMVEGKNLFEREISNNWATQGYRLSPFGNVLSIVTPLSSSFTSIHLGEYCFFSPQSFIYVRWDGEPTLRATLVEETKGVYRRNGREVDELPFSTAERVLAFKWRVLCTLRRLVMRLFVLCLGTSIMRELASEVANMSTGRILFRAPYVPSCAIGGEVVSKRLTKEGGVITLPREFLRPTAAQAVDRVDTQAEVDDESEVCGLRAIGFSTMYLLKLNHIFWP